LSIVYFTKWQNPGFIDEVKEAIKASYTMTCHDCIQLAAAEFNEKLPTICQRLRAAMVADTQWSNRMANRMMPIGASGLARIYMSRLLNYDDKTSWRASCHDDISSFISFLKRGLN
jgi:hypothetical protein